jgi:FixJ family two-component response regulator
MPKRNIAERPRKNAELGKSSRRLGSEANSQTLPVQSRPFPGDELLTPRERTVLAQIVRGASSREAAKALGVSPRTVEFHRANIMKKLGKKKFIDLLTLVLGEREGL